MKSSSTAKVFKDLSSRLGEVESAVEAAVEDLNETMAKDLLNRTKVKIPRLSGSAASSGKLSDSTVRFGGGLEYYPWLEFGGSVGRGGSVKRTKIQSGRYLFPTLTSLRERNLKMVEKEVVEAVEKSAKVEVK